MANEILQAGKFLEEQLRLVDPQIIRTVYPEMWGFEGKYHTVKSGLPFGTKEVFTTRIDSVGRAVNFGGKATDIPTATFGIDTDKYKTIAGVLSAEWGYEELLQQEAAQKSGQPFTVVNVVEEYNKALQKGLREWVHIRTLFGDPTLGFTGLFNSANVTASILTNDLYAMTPAELHLYIKSLTKDFKKGAKLTAVATDMLVNSDLYDKLTNPILNNNTASGGSVTPYELLTNPEKGTNLRQINEVNELVKDTLTEYGVIASADQYDMFMLYESSEETLDKMMSTQIITPVMQRDLSFKRYAMIKISEVRVKMPFRVKYYLYPKFTP